MSHVDVANFLITTARGVPRSGSRPTAVFIFTWREGYAHAHVTALEVERQGNVPVLLRLAGQNMPNDEFLRIAQQHRWPLLSLPNRFAGEFSDEQLGIAVTTAVNQWQEGWPAAVKQEHPRQARVAPAQDQRANSLTEDERRELLNALYGNVSDDGVR